MIDPARKNQKLNLIENCVSMDVIQASVKSTEYFFIGFIILISLIGILGLTAYFPENYIDKFIFIP